MKTDLVLDDRELAEIHHAIYYRRYLLHGTAGHNQLMLLGKLAEAMGFYLDVDDEDAYHQHAMTLMYRVGDGPNIPAVGLLSVEIAIATQEDKSANS